MKTQKQDLIEYTTTGTCSSAIRVQIQDGTVVQASFKGGCPGNLEAISRLVIGLRPEQVIERLKGIRCGEKSTSCADQLATAIQTAGWS